jgi:DNA (cytosine-5)-methyltransferase 1
MKQTPIEILENAYGNAKGKPIESIMSALPKKSVEDLTLVVEQAESQKGVLGVVLTSTAYKIFDPSQDIRKHQEHMDGGYSGRTFDTKYVTPFLKRRFPHFAMAESAWLTRSLEQPRPYDRSYPGNIRNQELKAAFLNILELLQTKRNLAPKILVALMALMLDASAEDEVLLARVDVSSDLTIARIIDAASQHIRYDYSVVGTARLPVVAIYSVYNLLMSDVKKYEGKILAPLESHTSPDSRSKALGDIEVKNSDGSCFEAIEIKHNKPITADTIGIAYRKIKPTSINRYYILTTNEPNFDNYDSVAREIEKYKKIHPCEIVVNGVIPSLKYYMRMVSHPQRFVDEYTKWLEFEFKRASAIKKEHLRVWQEIRQQVLNME